MPLVMTEVPGDGVATAAHLMLAHGASQPVTSRFFTTLVPMLLLRGVAVTRFEFDYMTVMRETKKRRPPPRVDTLLPEFVAGVEELSAQLRDGGNGEPLFIGGKSMGGRIASMVADELHRAGRIRGLVCLGYPFHPPKNPESLRTVHLAKLETPALFVQGVRDPFGTEEEVAGYDLSDAMAFHWVGDGDHDFGPRGKSGFTRRANIEGAAEAIARFAAGL